jgi:Outer membrane lipoprotein-sorting protein
MRKYAWLLAVSAALAVFLAGCGGKSADDVVKDLGSKLNNLESYKGSGTMTLSGGDSAQEYSVEVWFKQPNYYRIELTNKKKDVTQIVLRNDEGVFVLTPHLKKSFRFQSDWPKNQGQAYLYQTLVEGILNDSHRQLAEDKEKGAYVFEVAGNYPNHTFARQKIWLDKKDYKPQHVDIFDPNGRQIVSMHFSEFEFGSKFDKANFDMANNLAAFEMLSAVASATVDIGEAEEPAPDADTVREASFGIIDPAYMPEDVQKIGTVPVQIGDSEAVVLRFGGKYSYTLMESLPQAVNVSSPSGEIVDLGFTYGVLTGKEQKTLYWLLDGVEYRLSSGDLPKEEMIAIAKSVEGQVGK